MYVAFEYLYNRKSYTVYTFTLILFVIQLTYIGITVDMKIGTHLEVLNRNVDLTNE